MNIEFSIISRGCMLVKYGDRQAKISGELTFTPVFYADIKSIKNWEPPYENIPVTEEEKAEIIKRITEETKDKKLKIYFD